MLPWVRAFQPAVYNINMSMHGVTGNSPMQLMFGQFGVVPEDWPSPKHFSNTATYGPPAPGAHVTVKVPNPRLLQLKFSGDSKNS